jgi:hypothetical protein
MHREVDIRPTLHRVEVEFQNGVQFERATSALCLTGQSPWANYQLLNL